MSSYFTDPIEFQKPVSFTGDAAAAQAIVRFAKKSFVLANITAGLLTFDNPDDIPANALILGAYIKTTTQPAFSAGTTTGVTAKIGAASGDDDGYGQAIAIGGAIGLKVPEPGARLGVLNTSQDIAVIFTATGGTPDLAEVNAGAGTVWIAYALAPTT